MNQAAFTFTAKSLETGELEVAGMVGSEWVSKPYSFDIDVLVPTGEGPRIQRALGERASLRFHGSEGRRVAGIVARIQARGTADGLSCYRIRLVPALWLLGRRRNSRIFQNRSAPDIIRDVLAEHGVQQRWTLDGASPRREYCVQYRETDLAFVTRLLAEEGVFYFVVDPPPGEPDAPETVVFSDSASAYHPIAGDSTLRMRDSGALVHEEPVTSFRLAERMQSGSTVHRAFDFKRPKLDLRGEARVSHHSDLEVYDHDGDPEEGRIGGDGARTALEQIRARALIAEGESACRRLVPGRWFDLTEHSRDDLNRRYTVVRIDHEARQVAGPRLHGEAGEIYENHFRCVPEHVAYRPKRPRKLLQQVTETATVVGPPGEEIHVDEHGRIKILFHWDREAKRDEQRSCWIRTMQSWAGAAWGSQFIPRVGMEVVVTFVGGDVDRPMVIGTVYNAHTPPPYPLPRHKTRSGIRTRTTPGGGGFNELRFEDAAGEEQVLLHAQRNFDEVVGNDHTRLVRGDEAITVGRSSRIDVGGDQEVNVKGNELVTIDKNLVLHVSGKQIIHVDGRSADDGGDGGAEPRPEQSPGVLPVAEPGETREAAGLSEKALSGPKIAAAKLLFLRELVAVEHYARAKEWTAEVAGLQSRAMDLLEAARPLLLSSGAAGSPGPEAQALSNKAREIRSALDQSIRDALSPAPAPLQRLQIAVVDQLRAIWRQADAVEKQLAPGCPEATLPGGSGSARGGGGADVKPWTKTPKGQESVLNIASGGGLINSPDGLTFKGQGGEISIKDGVLRLEAGTIVLVGKTIEIVGSETILQGNPIRLN